MTTPVQNDTTITSPKPKEVWRSKLGTNYPKDFMEANEKRLFRELQAIRELPGNRRCADCGVPGTVWASVNLGVFLCMTCGAHHRSLGTHISLPKGCTGTYWWGPDELEQMKSMGNARAKKIFGDQIPAGVTKEDTQSWKQYLNDKYVQKLYTPPAEPATNVFAAPASPLPSPRLSKSKLANKLAMPDLDIMHFESSSTSLTTPPGSPKGVVPTPTNNRITKVPPPVGSDFFASFGL